MAGLKRVQHRHRVTVVLTRDEVKAIFSMMEGTSRLMAELLHGAGLRVHECVKLRVATLHRVDLASGAGLAPMPAALACVGFDGPAGVQTAAGPP